MRRHRLPLISTPFGYTSTYGKMVQTNSEGLREYEIPIAELHNYVVILCLGGSETFGKGVAFGKTYSKQLEKMLNASPAAQPLKVINAGVPDYNTLQQLRFLQERGRRYHPDVVIIGFYWDDLLPVSALEATGDRQAISREWALKAWARKYDLLDFIAPLYTRSRVLYLMRDELKDFFGLLQSDIRQAWLNAILEGQYYQPLEEAWQQLEAYLKEFVALARSDNFRLVLLILPIEQQFLRGYLHTRFQNIIAEKSHKLSITTLNMYEPFKAAYTDFASLFSPYDGRPNARAHTLIAEELYHRLLGR